MQKSNIQQLAIQKLQKEYNITTEKFYLKNDKCFLNSYCFHQTRQSYKYILEQFVIQNNSLLSLSEIINRDIVVMVKYIDGISKQIVNNKLFPIRIKEIRKEDIIIPELYIECKNINENLDSWRRD